MSGNVALDVQGLSKRYKLGTRQPYRRLGESLVRLAKSPFKPKAAFRSRETLWALKDVTFQIEEGEILGVVGANGAGKTTLLRILSKITLPTEGRAEVFGRVGSLLEVGTGFHPELTGRENVFLNGAILGMPRKEIAAKYDEIVAFAEIPEFMETPVKHYSSGMRVRLAFSVAAHLEPEILFIDEVLAVGDAAFQAKCLGKMEEVAGGGRTVLFVSHNMGMITSLCTKAMLFEHGRISMEGEPQEVVEAYLSAGYSSDGRWTHPEDATCGQTLRISSLEISREDGSISPTIPFDEPVRITVEHEVRQPENNVMLLLKITDMSGNVILTTSDVDADPSRGDWKPGRYRSVVEIQRSLLRPGRYLLTVHAKKRRGVKLDEHPRCLGLEIAPIRYAMQENRAGLITPIIPWESGPLPREVAG